jgi:hypothetical protein
MMRYFTATSRAMVLVTIVLLLAASTALALSDFDISWWTVDGGGGTASGGSYTLIGTIGQPDAEVLTGGDYTLGGGFWGGGAAAVEYRVYLPMVLRQYP